MTSALDGIPLRMAGKRQQPMVFKEPGKGLRRKIQDIPLACGPYCSTYGCDVMFLQCCGKSGLVQILTKGHVFQAVLCKPSSGRLVKPVDFQQQAPERRPQQVFFVCKGTCGVVGKANVGVPVCK